MRASLILFVLSALLSLHAHSQLRVDKAIVELSNQNSRSILRLSNTGEDTLYLRLDLAEVRDPGTARPDEIPIDNPLEIGLIVHPRQLVLAPGQTRSARVVMDGSVVSATDRVFRLQISPFAGDALIDAEAERTAGVRFLVGYQLLLLVRPDVLQPHVALVRGKSGIHLENSGNTNVLLRTLEVCDEEGQRCSGLRANRLYSGESLALPLPSGVSADRAIVKTREFVRSTEKRVEYTP